MRGSARCSQSVECALPRVDDEVTSRRPRAASAGYARVVGGGEDTGQVSELDLRIIYAAFGDTAPPDATVDYTRDPAWDRATVRTVPEFLEEAQPVARMVGGARPLAPQDLVPPRMVRRWVTPVALRRPRRDGPRSRHSMGGDCACCGDNVGASRCASNGAPFGGGVRCERRVSDTWWHIPGRSGEGRFGRSQSRQTNAAAAASPPAIANAVFGRAFVMPASGVRRPRR